MIPSPMLVLILSLLSPAHALTTDRSGLLLDLSAGVGMQVPATPTQGSALLGVSWWWGPYDSSYAIGRYWSLGLVDRLDAIPGGFELSPMAEIRRGVDLIVVGWAVGLGVGPTLPLVAGGSLGGTARASVTGEFRRHRFWSLSLRIEAGATWLDGQAAGTASVLLGTQFSRPMDGQPVE